VEGSLGVAAQSVGLEPAQGRGGKPAVELLIANPGQFLEIGGNIPRVRLKVGKGTGPSKALVPRTNLLADVAAGHPVVQVLGNLSRDPLGVAFQGVVGNAAARIHYPWADDGLGRAGLQTAGAGATVGSMGTVGN
jgi:hypothetical protein